MKRFTQKSLEKAAKILHISARLLKSRLGQEKPKPPKEVLRTGEVAAMLGCHNSSVVRWTDEGRLHTLFRHPGQGRRYQRSEVEAFIRDTGNTPLPYHPPAKSGKIKPKRSTSKPHAARRRK